MGGLEFDATRALEEVQVETLINYTARAVGLAESIVQETLNHVGLKKSGNILLKDIPMVKRRLTTMNNKLTEEKKILQNLIFKKGDNLLKDAYRGKALVTESTVDIARIGLMLHGGLGYTKRYAVERHLREAIGLTLIGTPTDIALSIVRTV